MEFHSVLRKLISSGTQVFAGVKTEEPESRTTQDLGVWVDMDSQRNNGTDIRSHVKKSAMGENHGHENNKVCDGPVRGHRH